MVWRKELPPLIVDTFIQQMNQLTDNRQVDYEWWPATAIRQKDINLLILDWTLIILNWKRTESKTQNYFPFYWTGNRFYYYYYYFQVKTKHFYYDKSEIKLPFKTRKKGKINMFMAGNCCSLCRYASRLDQKLLGASSWMNWIVNEHGC